MPDAVRRRCIHAGVVAAGSIPRTTRVTNRSHPTTPWTGAASSTSTGKPSGVAAGGSVGREPGRPGSVKRAPVECANSRATPR